MVPYTDASMKLNTGLHDLRNERIKLLQEKIRETFSKDVNLETLGKNDNRSGGNEESGCGGIQFWKIHNLVFMIYGKVSGFRPVLYTCKNFTFKI